VEVHRGPYLESVHRFWACAVRADGEIVVEIGEGDVDVPVRSLAKPFIAIELVRSGAAEALGLTEVDIALAAGSHDGQERHVVAVRSLLARIGLDESALLCGPAREGSVIVGPPIANNCSGKHAAVLALCRHLDVPTEHYIDEQHPVQRFLTAALLTAFRRNEHETPIVVDGCGMPIFGASLVQLAAAYGRFGTATDSASARVRSAMAAFPEYVGGSNGNLDTRIIASSSGAVLGKIGAEGLHADTLVGSGIGVAVKVLDGNSRALPPVLARLFVEYFGEGSISQRTLAELAAPSVLNAAGRRVGDIRYRWNTDV
jgi:L-asparaginase II